MHGTGSLGAQLLHPACSHGTKGPEDGHGITLKHARGLAYRGRRAVEKISTEGELNVRRWSRGYGRSKSGISQPCRTSVREGVGEMPCVGTHSVRSVTTQTALRAVARLGHPLPRPLSVRVSALSVCFAVESSLAPGDHPRLPRIRPSVLAAGNRPGSRAHVRPAVSVPVPGNDSARLIGDVDRAGVT